MVRCAARGRVSLSTMTASGSRVPSSRLSSSHPSAASRLYLGLSSPHLSGTVCVRDRVISCPVFSFHLFVIRACNALGSVCCVFMSTHLISSRLVGVRPSRRVSVDGRVSVSLLACSGLCL
jgi:hypothetical protein